MAETTSLEERVLILKTIADETRLRILGLLAERDHSGKELVDALGLTAPTISHHMRRLLTVGIVGEQRDAQRHVYSLNAGLLRTVRADEAPQSAPARGEQNDRARVLRHYFRDGKLTTIPAARKQRVLVLQHLLEQFEPGRQYPEKDVNALLGQFNQDFATLRRELVDYGYLVREQGIYQVASSLPKRSRNLQQEMPADEAEWLRDLITASIAAIPD